MACGPVRSPRLAWRLVRPSPLSGVSLALPGRTISATWLGTLTAFSRRSMPCQARRGFLRSTSRLTMWSDAALERVSREQRQELVERRSFAAREQVDPLWDGHPLDEREVPRDGQSLQLGLAALAREVAIAGRCVGHAFSSRQGAGREAVRVADRAGAADHAEGGAIHSVALLAIEAARDVLGPRATHAAGLGLIEACAAHAAIARPAGADAIGPAAVGARRGAGEGLERVTGGGGLEDGK